MKHTTKNYVQLIGTQRSGSNLLRVMLDQHKDLTAPHPPHILQVFSPIICSYGNLANEESRIELASDILKLLKCNPVPWGPFTPDPIEIARKAPHNSLSGILAALYNEFAEMQNAHTFCCKSLHNVFYHNDLEEAGLQARYIHIYRDGRDVASSFRHTPVGPKHIYFLAQKWAREQQACLDLGTKLGENRLIKVKYEDLITQPEKELQSICNWLGIKYDNRMLMYYRSETSYLASNSGSMWKNLVKPILRENIGKYIQELTEKDIFIFEQQAGEQLRTLGYKCPEHTKPHFYTDTVINDFENQDKALQEMAKQNMNISEKSKRKIYNDFIDTLNNKARQKADIC